MSPLPTDCAKEATPVQEVIERTRESLSEIFTKYRLKLRQEACEAAEKVRNRHSFGRIISRPSSESIKKGYGFCKTFACSEVATGVLLLMILLLLLLGLHLVRNYNHTFAYGSGGCLSTFFWNYDECLIMT
ncbi:uncharacterized protein LOC108105930 [Drosophila eugracilis]|uniref:uncharacterized protein LOC108105930 n=1 Tax=Drosophila eugracilis TaxID=29029 RepID=UPI0007E6CF89|nr:uncharacterized protein LOC108105930 [Drosophila eugracilis]